MTGKVRNSIGQQENGARAKTEIAPAANAISARRQPEARITK
jgi:hypothetical protein